MGSGKTSLLNLVQEKTPNVKIINMDSIVQQVLNSSRC